MDGEVLFWRAENAAWKTALSLAASFRSCRANSLQPGVGKSHLNGSDYARSLKEIERQEAAANTYLSRLHGQGELSQERQRRFACWRQEVEAGRQGRALLLAGLSDEDFFAGRTDIPPKLPADAAWTTLDGEQKRFDQGPLAITAWWLTGSIIRLAEPMGEL